MSVPPILIAVRLRAARWLAAVAALSVVFAGSAVLPQVAAADSTQKVILQDDPLLLTNPDLMLHQARLLGVDMMRMMVRWQTIAPNPNSFKRPAGFDASNPADYSAAAWLPYDRAIEAARANSIPLDVDVLGGAPLWATGSGMPKGKPCPCHNWAPSAVQFGQFVRAMGIRYGGDWDPTTNALAPGKAGDLPRVSFWSIWNEPDYGPSLAPQARPGHRGVEDSPRLYRLLVDQAWAALHATGHGSDTILIGELAPRSNTKDPFTFGQFDGMLPTVFLQAMYCVNSRYRELRGRAAALRGCPTTASRSARFAANNPGLFKASGVSDHPYMRWFPPDDEENVPYLKHFHAAVADYTTLATIGHLETAMTRALAPYRVHRSFPIWNTEFGYITSPPKRLTKTDRYPYASQATAAYYDNWAEYISWKNPLIQSFEQYLLQDPAPATSTNDYGGFASGLLDYSGAEKPGYVAFRMPLFLPQTTSSSPSQPLEVWGAVKPVHFTGLDLPGDSESVNIQFAPAGTSSFTTIDSVKITSSEGYFDTEAAFTASGTVRLEWTYPNDPLLGVGGDTIYSRTQAITVK